VILFSLRFFFQFIQLSLLVVRNGIANYQGYHLVFIDRRCSPFSFFNIIFVDKKEIQNIKPEAILVHEQVHIRQAHTLDIILLEILTVIFWFNPFIWLITRDLKSIHEFLADEGVLKTGYDKIDYQELILNKTMGVQISSFSNNFNVSVLKNRIIMMTKNRSTKWMKTKILFIFPAMAAIIVILSANTYVSERPEGDNNEQITQNPIIPATPNKATDRPMTADTPATSQAHKDKKVFGVVEKLPSYVGGETARIKFFTDNIKYPDEAVKNGVSGTVFITFIVRSDGAITDIKILRGIGSGCDEEAIRVVKMMPKWIPGEHRGTKVDVQFNLPIKFKFQEKSVPGQEKKTN